MRVPSHRISIPALLETGAGTLAHIGTMLKKAGISNVVLVFGEGIKELFGDIIINSLNKSSINTLSAFENNDINIENVTHIAFQVPAGTQAVIGVGGGKALDTAKYMSFLNNIQFISIPTSASNDGFSSSTCSFLINGKRKSVPAKMPYGIIVDFDVIKSSPEKFIYSGVGDLLSKITALHDWELEEEKGITVMDGFAAMIARKSVNSFIRMEGYSIRNELFLEELIESLVMSGVSMEIAGNSAPASGSEHLISHALDEVLDLPQLHGVQVGIATYIMSLVQENDHEKIKKIFHDTGFLSYVKELGMKKDDFQRAIERAPFIKPDRCTYIHIPENREKARKFLEEDDLLKEILV
ncbi:MAG: iron-containing alcohol dehydrogenase family protein [Deltaproteobacteria bacterium]